MAQRRTGKRPGKLKLPAAFKKAIAAAAMSKLVEGGYGEDAAARFVVAKAGDMVFPSQGFIEAMEELKKIRNKALKEKNNEGKLVSIARFHYFHCLKLVDRHMLDPKMAADILLKTMLTGVVQPGKG